MPRNPITPLPRLARRMTAFGENLQLARLRRRLTASQVAERAGISRPTLTAAERGDSGVSFGVYANILFVLGLDGDLDALARDDELGRKLQDAGLLTPKRVRRKAQATSVGGSGGAPSLDESARDPKA